MNKFAYSTLFIIILFSSLNAQIDTTSLSYYPLQDGDYWEYVEAVYDSWGNPPMTTYSYYSLFVIGDTILSNGKTYKIIEKKELDTTTNSTFIFKRIDTLACNVYQYSNYDSTEYLIDSLRAHPGDSSNASRMGPEYGIGTNCLDISADTVLSIFTTTKLFEQPIPLLPTTYKLSSGFGLTYLFYSFDFGTSTLSLQYAVINGIEYGTQVDQINSPKDTPLISFELEQNYPNPFNSTTTIKYTINKPNKVNLLVFDITGKIVDELVNKVQQKGTYKEKFNSDKLSSGVYFYQLKINNLSLTRKMLILQ